MDVTYTTSFFNFYMPEELHPIKHLTPDDLPLVDFFLFCSHEDMVSQKMKDFLAKNPDFQLSILVLLPMYHMYGQVVLIFGLIRGYKVVTLPRFIPEKFLGAIEKYKVCNNIYDQLRIQKLGGQSQETLHYKHFFVFFGGHHFMTGLLLQGAMTPCRWIHH